MKTFDLELITPSKKQTIIAEIQNGCLSQGGSSTTEVYTGNYLMTPSFERQELKTKGKLMRDNVVLEEIPIFIVSNIANGNTVIIGG